LSCFDGAWSVGVGGREFDHHGQPLLGVTSAVREPSWPILASFGPTSMPDASAGPHHQELDDEQHGCHRGDYEHRADGSMPVGFSHI
jgi:hypothetical protein